MKTFKTIAIVVGVLLAVWFISSKIEACNVRKDLQEQNDPYVDNRKIYEDSIKAFRERETILNSQLEAKNKSVDSLNSIKNYVEKDLLASKSRAERLVAENARLKNQKDTSGQLQNCDELAQETLSLTVKVGEYKKQYDSLDLARQQQLAIVEKQREDFKRSFNKADSLYTSSYKYSQNLYGQLQKTTRKANKTVSITLTGGYGPTYNNQNGGVRLQPFVGIGLSKTLIRLLVKPITLFTIWFAFVLIIYITSKPPQAYLFILSFLNVVQIASMIGIFISRKKSYDVTFGSLFIISNYIIFKILDPFPAGIGIFVGLASSALAMLVLVNIKKEGK